MTTLPQISEHLQQVLTTIANEAGRRSGFIQRKRKLDGASFVQALVFGWLDNPQASLEDLCQSARVCGVQISAQGLAERFTEQAAECLKQVLEHSLRIMVEAEGGQTSVLGRFNGVYLQDSTVVSLPLSLHSVWSGCGNQAGHSAGLKLQTILDYQHGRLSFQLHPAHRHDNPLQSLDLPAGALRLADTGYFHLQRLQTLSQRGVYWLTRLPAHVQVWDEQHPYHLSEWLNSHAQQDECDMWVRLGAQGCLCRLLAQRVSPDVAQQRQRRLQAEARRRGQPVSTQALALCHWTLMVTNLPASMLSLSEALVLLRLRWQIELLFKLFKSHAHLSTSRSQQPWRILCQVYAKLLGLVIQHWLLILGCWHLPDRSLVKAARVVRNHALLLASVLLDLPRLLLALSLLTSALATCRIHKRKTRPATFQLLAGLSFA